MVESLNPFDLFVLIAIVATMFWGGMRGMISQVASLFSWIASAYIATHHYSLVTRFMSANYAYRNQLAMIIAFIGSAILIRFGANVLKRMISLAGMREFDRQMGALLGMIKGFVLCLLVTFTFVVLNDSTRSVIKNSKTGPPLASFIAEIQKRFPETELTNNYIAHVDRIEKSREEEAQARGEEPKSIATEVRNLSEYLKSRVLSVTAADIAVGAENSSGEDFTNSIGSLLERASSSMQRLGEAFNVDNPFSNNSSSGGSSTSAFPTFRQNTLSDNTVDEASQRSESGSASIGASNFGQYRRDDYDEYNQGYVNEYGSGYQRSYGAQGATSPSSGQMVAENSSSNAGGNTAAPNSQRDLGGLSSFLSSIGGGFGGYSDSSTTSGGSTSSEYDSAGSSYTPSGNYNSEYYDSEQTSGTYYRPRSRSNASQTYDSNAASRSRLNSRTYTIQ